MKMNRSWRRTGCTRRTRRTRRRRQRKTRRHPSSLETFPARRTRRCSRLLRPGIWGQWRGRSQTVPGYPCSRARVHERTECCGGSWACPVAETFGLRVHCYSADTRGVSFCLCICLNVRLSVCPSVCVSVCPCIRLTRALYLIIRASSPLASTYLSPPPRAFLFVVFSFVLCLGAHIAFRPCVSLIYRLIHPLIYQRT